MGGPLFVFIGLHPFLSVFTYNLTGKERAVSRSLQTEGSGSRELLLPTNGNTRSRRLRQCEPSNTSEVERSVQKVSLDAQGDCQEKMDPF